MMRVFVDVLPYFVRPNNTDWKYNFNLRKIDQFPVGVSMHYPGFSVYSVCENLKYVTQRVKAKSGFSIGPQSIFRELDGPQLRASGCDVIFCHDRFPCNHGRLPVLWQYSVLDPVMQIARGHTQQEIDAEIDFKRPAFSAAAVVQVSTASEARRLAAVYPSLAEKFHYIPFFLPNIESVSDEEVRSKFASGPISITFVGREARRKGLPELLEALDLIGVADSEQVEINVVSNFGDGPIQMPKWSNLRHFKSMPHCDVLDLVKRSHIVAMPSKFEGYGFVFIEAMAAGAVILVPNWEVQREIADFGSAGIVSDVDVMSIANALQAALKSKSELMRLALAGINRYRAHYSPGVVARRYGHAFAEAKKMRIY